MSPAAHEHAFRAVLAAARPGARIVYWNMMVPRRVPVSLASKVVTVTADERRLAPLDKAFFYRDFVVEAVR
jgi:S-adenosylmethionine-diacylglycerol 3-amino-3-carboxypropyl transferase